MAKKFTEELTKLTTPDIRSTLRYLNNNVEKNVKPTELASMKHDKCLALIEKHYKPGDIEKALDVIASGGGKKASKAKAAKSHTPKTEPTKAVTDGPAPDIDSQIAARLKAIRDFALEVEELLEKKAVTVEKSVQDML